MQPKASPPAQGSCAQSPFGFAAAMEQALAKVRPRLQGENTVGWASRAKE